MKCVSPFLVIKDNQWVPCGKCNFCVQKKRSEWSFRLYQELKVSKTANFVTLTYADENLAFDVTSRKPTLEKSHVQKFFKRLRYEDSKKWRSTVRYYTVGEYGSTYSRPHYHSILFNLHPDILSQLPQVWGHGHVDIGVVEPASIAYVSGYVISKASAPIGVQKPFALISKPKGGLGRDYLTPAMIKWHKRGKRNYAQQYGYQVPLARIYKDKIFTKLDKMRMGLEMDEIMNDLYLDEVERLSALHDDPIAYYQQKTDQAYQRVKTSKPSKF